MSSERRTRRGVVGNSKHGLFRDPARRACGEVAHAMMQLRRAPSTTRPRRGSDESLLVRTPLRAKLEEARMLMSHQNPGGEFESVLEEALDLLIPALKKQKFATNGAGDRRISSEVKERVWERDGGRCTFVGEDGRSCGSSWKVEFDHVEPAACGGEATVENVRCLCRAHNQLEAERRFGAGFMKEKRRRVLEARKSSRIEMKGGTRAGAGWHPTGPNEGTRAGADLLRAGNPNGRFARSSSADRASGRVPVGASAA